MIKLKISKKLDKVREELKNDFYKNANEYMNMNLICQNKQDEISINIFPFLVSL